MDYLEVLEKERRSREVEGRMSKLKYSSTKELGLIADDCFKKIDRRTSILMYYRSARQVLEQARIYKIESDLERSYIMSIKFLNLVVKFLPNHPEYPDCSTLSERIRLEKIAPDVVSNCEELKRDLTKLYDEKKLVEKFKKENESSSSSGEQVSHLDSFVYDQADSVSFKNLYLERDRQTKVGPDDLCALKGVELEAKKGQEEIFGRWQRKREMEEEQEQERIRREELEREQEQLRREREELQALQLKDDAKRERTSSLMRRQIDLERRQEERIKELEKRKVLREKELEMEKERERVRALERAQATVMWEENERLCHETELRRRKEEKKRREVEKRKREAKEEVRSREASPPTLDLFEDGGGMRKIVVNGLMFNKFMELADSNTRREIETCGILTGTLRKGVFLITNLLIPSQKGSPDTVYTTNEDEIFAYQEKRNLLSLGWIHTHPSHSCFLSSVDMHCQSGYQTLMKEAVAVVIAPKYNPNFGIFSLAVPQGLREIQNCPRSGFHPHDRGLYATASHVDVQFGEGAPPFQVVDIRKK